MASLTFLAGGSVENYIKEEELTEKYLPVSYTNSQKYDTLFGDMDGYDEKKEIYDMVTNIWDEVINLVQHETTNLVVQREKKRRDIL